MNGVGTRMKVKTPVSTPMVTVRADTRESLVSAAGRKAEQLSSDTGSHHVLVVYGESSAQIFCEPPQAQKKAKKDDVTGPETPFRRPVKLGN